MITDNDIVVAIKLLARPGKGMDDGGLQNLTDSLENCLKQSGYQEGNADGLLLFSFRKLSSAYVTVFQCFKQIKKELSRNSTKNKLPVRVIFHYPSKGGPAVDNIYAAESPLWESLAEETLYVTAPLKSNWLRLLGEIDLPTHLFEKAAGQLFLVRFFPKATSPDKLYFPHRDLTVQGKMPECYYCGMKDHPPAECPSKLLAPDLQGISDLGYLPVSEISDQYKLVFANRKKYVALMETGVPYPEIRKDPALLTFITYYDLLKIYQPRFLWDMTFSKMQVWKNSLETFSCKLHNQNLAIGFDCLRVGQYQQAGSMFDKEFKRPFGQYFYATVGRAFIALETGSIDDMKSHLKKANFLANNEKERVYAALLTARVWAVTKEWQKSSRVLSELLGTVNDCIDAQYAQILTGIHCGATERTFEKLRDIIDGHEKYFLVVLLDPLLLPVQPLVDEMLAAIFREKEQEAQEELLEVVKTRDCLIEWADTEDNDARINVQALQELEEKFKRRSYFDYVDVVEKCNNVHYGLKQVQQKQLARMTRDLNGLTTKFNRAASYWEKYPYQVLFKTYDNHLKEIKAKLARVHSQVENQENGALRDALALLTTINEDWDALASIQRRMSLADMVATGLLLFGKNLLILEIVFGAFAFAILIVSNLIGPGTFAEGLVGRLMLPATMVAAPLIALVTSLIKVMNKYL